MESTVAKSDIKENPKFLIASSIIVPIAVSVIGLAGVILPNFIQPQNTSIPSEQEENTTEGKPADVGTTPVKLQDDYGFVSMDNIVAVVNSKSYSNLNLDNKLKNESSIELQRINETYYLVGFSKEKLEDSNLITNVPKDDYRKMVGIKLEEITSIEKKSVKIKKDTIVGLQIRALGYTTALTSH